MHKKIFYTFKVFLLEKGRTALASFLENRVSAECVSGTGLSTDRFIVSHHLDSRLYFLKKGIDFYFLIVLTMS